MGLSGLLPAQQLIIMGIKKLYVAWNASNAWFDTIASLCSFYGKEEVKYPSWGRSELVSCLPSTVLRHKDIRSIMGIF